MTKRKRTFVCGRIDPEDGRRKKCAREKDGNCYSGSTLAKRPPETCPIFKWPKKRLRYNGPPAVEPKSPTTPQERLVRWRAILSAFQKSTGISTGTPPQTVYRLVNAEQSGLLPNNYSIPSLGSADDERWPGRDAGSLSVLQSKEFIDATWKLPRTRPGAPEYTDLVAAEKAWVNLRNAARIVVECREEAQARHQACCGLQDWKTDSEEGVSRWASAWLDVPPDVEAAAKVLADATIPNVKVVNGRPSEGKTDGLSAVIAVLQRIRCPDGRELTIPELTWLLMLALPGKFLYEDELKLRARVQKAKLQT